jgi:hypothetical protein
MRVGRKAIVVFECDEPDSLKRFVAGAEQDLILADLESALELGLDPSDPMDA